MPCQALTQDAPSQVSAMPSAQRDPDLRSPHRSCLRAESLSSQSPVSARVCGILARGGRASVIEPRYAHDERVMRMTSVFCSPTRTRAAARTPFAITESRGPWQWLRPASKRAGHRQPGGPRRQASKLQI